METLVKHLVKHLRLDMPKDLCLCLCLFISSSLLYKLHVFMPHLQTSIHHHVNKPQSLYPSNLRLGGPSHPASTAVYTSSTSFNLPTLVPGCDNEFKKQCGRTSWRIRKESYPLSEFQCTDLDLVMYIRTDFYQQQDISNYY
jgi:hypothetical protein